MLGQNARLWTWPKRTSPGLRREGLKSLGFVCRTAASSVMLLLMLSPSAPSALSTARNQRLSAHSSVTGTQACLRSQTFQPAFCNIAPGPLQNEGTLVAKGLTAIGSESDGLRSDDPEALESTVGCIAEAEQADAEGICDVDAFLECLAMLTDIKSLAAHSFSAPQKEHHDAETRESSVDRFSDPSTSRPQSFSEFVGNTNLKTNLELETLQSELDTLLMTNEHIQEKIAAKVREDRIKTKVTEIESTRGDTFLLPVQDVVTVAKQEVLGGRKASRHSAHGPCEWTEGEEGIDGPILAKHKRARDDILALKLLYYLEAGAHTAESTRQLLKQSEILTSKITDAKNHDRTKRMNCQGLSWEAIAADLEEESAQLFVRNSTHFISGLVEKLNEKSDESETIEELIHDSGLRNSRTPVRGTSDASSALRMRGGGEQDPLEIDTTKFVAKKIKQPFDFLPDQVKNSRRIAIEVNEGSDPWEDNSASESRYLDNLEYPEQDPLETDSDTNSGLEGMKPPAIPEQLKDEEEKQMDAEEQRLDELVTQYWCERPQVKAMLEGRLHPDPRVRLAAHRSYVKKMLDGASEKPKAITRREWEREQQVALLRKDLMYAAYGGLGEGWISKEEANAILDRKETSPAYKYLTGSFLDQALQFDDPEDTLKAMSYLKMMYSDKPRKGGLHPALLYPEAEDPEGECKAQEMEDGSAMNPRFCRFSHNSAIDAVGILRLSTVGRPFMSEQRRSPRHQVFQHGDWDTRIPGLNPIMPAVNSKHTMTALVRANETATKRIEERRRTKELAQEQLRIFEERIADPETLQGSEEERKREILLRWGTLESEGLNQVLFYLVRDACMHNETYTPSVKVEGVERELRGGDSESMANISLIIEDGAQVNAVYKDKHGWTPLHVAALVGNATVAEFLVSLGGNVAAKSNNGATPLHIAAMTDRPRVLLKLLDLGAKIEAKNNFGQTALHVAASAACEGACQALLSRGADATVMDNDKMKPIDHLDTLDVWKDRVKDKLGHVLMPSLPYDYDTLLRMRRLLSEEADEEMGS